MRAWGIALLLFATGCVTAHTTVTYSDEPAPTAQDAAVDASLKRAIAAAETQIGLLPAVATTAIEYVDANAARAAVRQFQQQIVRDFNGPQYAGIQPELRDLARSDRFAQQLPVQRLPGVSATPKNSVYEACQAIADFVRDLTARPDKRVTFHVMSEPKEAEFKICPQYLTEQCQWLMTDGDVARLLRGYYTYSLQLAGYKPVSVNIDMVPFAKTRLRCILRKNDDPRAAGPCTPE